MKATNKIEEKALAMLKAGKPVHGLLRDVLIDMMLREEEEKEED